jgi:hypothetical protein
MAKKQSINGSELQGNAWVFTCMGNAQAAYRRVLAKTAVTADQQDTALASGFFGMRPVFVFLWRSGMDPELVASVERLAILGGGHELEENLKEELLRQARQRRRRPPGRRSQGGVMPVAHPGREARA